MKKNGFTLMEIMIVVSITGLLMAMGALAVVKGMTNTRINQAESELEIIATAMLQLAWDTGRWPNRAIRTNPGSREVWALSASTTGLLEDDSAYKGWRGPYLDSDILIDPWGNPYFFDPDYRVDGVMRVAVGSFGPNRVGRNMYDNDDVFVRLDD